MVTAFAILAMFIELSLPRNLGCFNLLLPVQVPMVDRVEGSEEPSAWWAFQGVVFQLFSIRVELFLMFPKTMSAIVEKKKEFLEK